MSTEFIAHVTAEDPAEDRIPAHEMAQSLEGMARGFVLIGHYLSEGKIRRKPPFSENISFYLEPPRRRSWEAVFLAIINSPELLPIGAVAAGIAGNFLTDAIRHIFSRVTGRPKAASTPELDRIGAERPGDLEALVEAIEPGIARAHTVIGRGASCITIIHGDNNIVNLDRETKDYVRNARMLPDDELLDASVSALNALEGSGRIFLHPLGRTVPFSIARRADPGTIAALSHSLNRYASEQPSDVQIRFRRVIVPDGRVKRIVILSARIPNE